MKYNYKVCLSYIYKILKSILNTYEVYFISMYTYNYNYNIEFYISFI